MVRIFRSSGRSGETLSGAAARPRVAFVAPLLRGRGGWATFTIGAVHALAQYVDPVIVAARADREAALNVFPGAEIALLPEIQPMAAGAPRVLARMLPTFLALAGLKPLKVDLVHSMEVFPAGWVGDALARRLGVPHVASACGTYAVLWRRDPLLAIPYRRVLRRAAGVYAISHGTEAKMRAAFAPGAAPAGLRTMVIGTDAAARIPRETAWNRRPPADPVVLSVGGVKPRKGYSAGLRAFALFQRKFPAARYVVVGRNPQGAYRRSLEEIISAEGIRRVEFLDVVDDARLDALYREASMFLLLSREEGDRFEGFGMVYLEAGAYGLPVIGGRTGGIPDAVADGETGFLLDPDDAPGAAEAMARLASDAGLAERMGRAGRDKAEVMTWERYAREQFRAYPPALHP